MTTGRINQIDSFAAHLHCAPGVLPGTTRTMFLP